MPRSGYTPPDDVSRQFAKYKRVREQEAELRADMRRLAPEQLRAGATVGQLAEWTGLTAEFFRKIAREEGIERLRPPTVGKLHHD